jgi:hypothetical protein
MASTSTARCIAVATKAGKIELAVKLTLLANVGNGGGVFLDAAMDDATAAGMTAHQFAGGLGALTVKGIYRASDEPTHKGMFGYVNTNA